MPLSDANLFVGRKSELEVLQHAAENFKKGRFAAVSIVGEKGSGTTTLLNFFEKEYAEKFEYYRFNNIRGLWKREALLMYFSEKFNHQFNSQEQFVEFLNQGDKKVIVIENIQKQFLKSVNGFEALRMLSEIISLTSDRTMWVVTCTKYGWNYLDKTIKLADHFSYHIALGEFKDEVITNIILKRHRISGFDLYFLPTKEHLNNKNFKKLNEEERQEQLQAEYFKDLNKIAKSNVSLALMYWVRSTKEVKGDIIYISSLKEMDFSFIQNLSAEKLYNLSYLILNDGLEEAAFALCTQKDISQTRAILYPLFEDGVLIKNDSTFLINPLIYRQLVDSFKSKNIIH